jgi:hypothetical protein
VGGRVGECVGRSVCVRYSAGHAQDTCRRVTTTSSGCMIIEDTNPPLRPATVLRQRPCRPLLSCDIQPGLKLVAPAEKQNIGRDMDSMGTCYGDVLC